MTRDRFNLERFVEAQQDVYEAVRGELRAGRKRGHWMWFIFPQVRGLGHSYTSRLYAISGLDEAVAFLDHPVLGRRLRECTALANAIRSSSAREVFGPPDDLKFHSSMTLFAHAANDKAVFLQALEKYFGSTFDPLTLQRL
ncbi:MAG TPA: DUF1810 domain-containing protein [Thermoanaerobaculia bacterium]